MQVLYKAIKLLLLYLMVNLCYLCSFTGMTVLGAVTQLGCACAAAADGGLACWVL